MVIWRPRSDVAQRLLGNDSPCPWSFGTIVHRWQPFCNVAAKLPGDIHIWLNDDLTVMSPKGHLVMSPHCPLATLQRYCQNVARKQFPYAWLFWTMVAVTTSPYCHKANLQWHLKNMGTSQKRFCPTAMLPSQNFPLGMWVLLAQLYPVSSETLQGPLCHGLSILLALLYQLSSDTLLGPLYHWMGTLLKPPIKYSRELQCDQIDALLAVAYHLPPGISLAQLCLWPGTFLAPPSIGHLGWNTVEPNGHLVGSTEGRPNGHLACTTVPLTGQIVAPPSDTCWS